MTRKKILLLGSSGFVGSSTLFNLARDNYLEIVSPSRNQINSRESNGSRFSGLQEILNDSKPDVVINCIAETAHIECEIGSQNSYLANVELPSFLAGILTPDTHFIHFSTDAVFGLGRAPYSVDDGYSPASAYGSQKAQADGIVSVFENVSVIRGAFFGTSRNGKPGILNFFLDALESNCVIDGFTDYVNNPISCSTLANVLKILIENGPQGVLHLGNSNPTSKFLFGIHVAELMGYESKFIVGKESPKGMVSHGGLNLTLESTASWNKLGIRQPTLVEELSGELDKFL